MEQPDPKENPPWWDQECADLHVAKWTLYKATRKRITGEQLETYLTLQKQLKRVIRAKKRRHQRAQEFLLAGGGGQEEDSFCEQFEEGCTVDAKVEDSSVSK